MTDLTDHEKLEAIGRILDTYSYEVLDKPPYSTIWKILNDEPFDADE